MRKIALIILAITTIPTYATTMCAKNDTVAVILDPSIIATDSGSDATLGTWWAQFPFGRVSGIVAYINRSCTHGEIVSNLTDVNNNGETKYIVGGERYGNTCYCKLTHPAASKWVCNTYNGLINDFTRCVSNCGGFLSKGILGIHSQPLEEALFGSIDN